MRGSVETFEQTSRAMKGSLAVELWIADARPDPLQRYIESISNGE